MTDNITMPRSVVERALEALDEADLLMEHRQNIELRRSALAALRAALDQPQVEQEPYVWYDIDTGDTWTVGAIADGCSAPDGIIPLYNNPQPPRQPLTDEQIDGCWYQAGGLSVPFARAIERAHGIGGEA